MTKPDNKQKPFIIRYREFWTNVQAMIFYPFQNIGPFIVAAMPALFTGHSVYTWYAETSAAWLAMLISCVVAIAMEAININVVHTSLDLFEQKQNGKGWLMALFSLIVMALVSTVIGFSEGDLSPLIKGLAVSSPWLTGIVYLAVGMAQGIHQEKQQADLDRNERRQSEAEQREFERQLKLKEIDKNHELRLAKIEAAKSVQSSVKPTVQSSVKGLTPEDVKNAVSQSEKPVNITQLAKDLQVSRTTLYTKLNGLVDSGEMIKNGNGYEVIK